MSLLFYYIGLVLFGALFLIGWVNGPLAFIKKPVSKNYGKKLNYVIWSNLDFRPQAKPIDERIWFTAMFLISGIALFYGLIVWIF